MTRSCINEAVKKFSDKDIRLLGIYVDDILGVMNKNVIGDVEKEILKDQKFLKLKMVKENERKETIFLNVTIQRSMLIDGKSILSFKWFKKECSAGRIPDYQSSHPLSMKISVCNECVKNALMVSDKTHWNEVERELRSVFVTSNYPGRFLKNRIFNAKKKINNPRRLIKNERKDDCAGGSLHKSPV